MPENSDLFLGIDIGSVYVHYVLMDRNRQIVRYENVPHFGNVRTVLQEHLNRTECRQIRQIAFNKRAQDFFTAGQSINEQVALIEGIRYWYQNRAT